jgi:hypothetical protein
MVTFADFWPVYVRAHSKLATRLLHSVGTLIGWILLGAAIAVHRWWWIAAALIVAYALAWISHFFIEQNKPATFEHPLWSWWADQRMVFLTVTGHMGKEVQKYATSNPN